MRVFASLVDYTRGRCSESIADKTFFLITLAQTWLGLELGNSANVVVLPDLDDNKREARGVVQVPNPRLFRLGLGLFDGVKK